MYALYACEHGRALPDMQIVRDTINNNDVELAKRIIVEYEMIHPNNVNPE